jgi:hypothetical protein
VNNTCDEGLDFAYFMLKTSIVWNFVSVKEEKEIQGHQDLLLDPAVRLQMLNNKYLCMRVKLPHLLIILDKSILH